MVQHWYYPAAVMVVAPVERVVASIVPEMTVPDRTEITVAENCQDFERWDIHPSMELGILLPKTGTNPDCWMNLPATARLFKALASS